MKRALVSYLATGTVFLVLDAIWLASMANRLYRPQLGDMLLDGFRLAPAIVFYMLYIAGVVVFAVNPAFISGRSSTALFHGAFLGLIAYATYDLTNLATLKNWPFTVTIADMVWGTTVTAIAATAGYLITRKLVAA